MVIINTVSDNYFSFNGINYAKIYQPLEQGTDYLGLYNIYETGQQLLSSTKYDQFEIDGASYASSAEVISQLLDVVYSKRLVVSGNYVNNPDNEDIEEVGNVLKLKDRLNTSGELGYRIIRADFDFETIPASYANCIWEIRYIHDLGGLDITLPANVVLRFKGGKIVNYGSFTLNNTRVEASEVLIFDSLPDISGDFQNDIIYPKWFGISESATAKLKEAEINTIKTLLLEKLDTLQSTIVKLSGGSSVQEAADLLLFPNNWNGQANELNKAGSIIAKINALTGVFRIVDKDSNVVCEFSTGNTRCPKDITNTFEGTVANSHLKEVQNTYKENLINYNQSGSSYKFNNEDIETTKLGGGIIVRSPDSSRRVLISVDNTYQIIATPL